jgi:cytochrome c nitrite reductase small subunit
MISRNTVLLALAAGIGLAAGAGAFTFIYARGASYLTNDPAACANCHVMREHYEGWLKSSHHSVAVCNDCHTPAGLIPKYLTKGLNGFWHSYAFTTGWFPDSIQIGARNREVTEGACRKCHADIVQAIEGPHGQSGRTSCVRCHGSVGHLR